MRESPAPRSTWLGCLLIAATGALAPGCQVETQPSGAAAGASRTQPAPTPPPTPTPTPSRVAAPTSAISYRLSFPAPATHYVEVEARIPVVPTRDGRPDQVELFMAVWTPGSYLVREYSRHVEDLRASTPAGAALELRKVRKNRWRVHLSDDSPAAQIVLRYRLYAREMSVRTNFVDDQIAILNGAPTFVSVRGGQHLAHEVVVEPAPGWEAVVTALPAHPDGAPNHFVAADFDTLVDAPIVAGTPQVHRYEVAGVPHRIATFLADERWDGARVAQDLETLTRAHMEMWGQIPYREYVFLFVLSGAGGGLEHLGSSLMMGSPWTTKNRSDYIRWLGLASHELFHAWNGKRLRPLALGPFDYEHEVYTPSLWVVEGLTSYYDGLLLRRAGLVDDGEYLAELSRRIEAAEAPPGKDVQSLSESSYDAWIKFYRPDENSANTSISYYSKGAAVGFLLDAELRRHSAGRRSLDDLLRRAYQRYAGARGYTAAEFRQLAAEVAGAPLDEFFARTVDSPGSLDYEPALQTLGLRLSAPAQGNRDGEQGDGGDGGDDETPGWLGARTATEHGRLVVTEVPRDTPAHEAGVNVGDELLATDDYRLPAAGLDQQLGYYRPGDRVSLLIARRGVLRRIPVTLGRAPETSWTLTVDSGADRRRAAARSRWLEDES